MRNSLTADSVLRWEFVQNIEEWGSVDLRSKRRGIKLRSFQHYFLASQPWSPICALGPAGLDRTPVSPQMPLADWYATDRFCALCCCPDLDLWWEKFRPNSIEAWKSSTGFSPGSSVGWLPAGAIVSMWGNRGSEGTRVQVLTVASWFHEVRGWFDRICWGYRANAWCLEKGLFSIGLWGDAQLSQQ